MKREQHDFQAFFLPILQQFSVSFFVPESRLGKEISMQGGAGTKEVTGFPCNFVMIKPEFCNGKNITTS
ncbi:MAG: hypothetical protein BWK80_56770 [Desulfobacteraceae bacterium IS3]|nr:MAG: hypothetical protein BWK80_56770 [Desulfobacteraceae bacterium IS3]